MALYPNELRDGADVFSADGHKLGELQRVVLRRADLSATHIVIDIGFLRSGRAIWEGGFGLEYDRVVPISAVASHTEERINLNVTAEQFKDAPEYTTESFEAPQDLTPAEFDIPDVVNNLQTISSAVNSTANFWLVEKLARSPDSIDLKEGTSVWRREPHEKLGDVIGVILDEQSGAARALVIERGAILKRDVILPMRHVVEVDDIAIRVDITDAELEQLREHKP